MKRSSLLFVALLLTVGFALRLSNAGYAQTIYDQQSYDTVVSIVAHGGNLYAETARYNYTPLWAWIMVLLRTTGLPLYIAVRVFLGLVDIVNALIISQIARQVYPGSEWRALALYLFNPVAIFVVGFDGQFETLAMLPLLLGVWLYVRQRKPAGYPYWLFAVIALLVKHIVIFHVWTFLLYVYKPRKAAVVMTGALGLFALSFAPYLPAGLSGVVQNVLCYHSISGAYGLSTVIPAVRGTPLFMGLMVGLPVLAYYRRLRLLPALLLVSVAFLTFTAGIGDQYFILVAFFAVLQPSILYWLFSVMAATNIPTGWNPLAVAIQVNAVFQFLMLNAVWAVCLFWFTDLFWRMLHCAPHSDFSQSRIAGSAGPKLLKPQGG